MPSERVVRGHDVVAVACSDGDEDGAIDVRGLSPDGVEVSGHVDEAGSRDVMDGADVVRTRSLHRIFYP